MFPKIIFTVLLTVLLFSCNVSKKENYTIKGSLTGTIDTPLILSMYDGTKAVPLDTTTVESGSFLFKGSLEHPVMLILQAEGQRQFLQFFGENSPISISGDIDSLYQAKVEGSDLQDLYLAFKENMKNFDLQGSKLRIQYQQATEAQDQEKAIAIGNQFRVMEITRKENIKQFIASNNTSPVAAYLALNVFINDEYAQQYEILASLDSSLANHDYYKVLKENIDLLGKLQLGKEAPDFTLTSKEGEEVALSSLRGSYVLIDFWASWCQPCRKANPGVVEKYNQFNDKGFTVLSVSVDNDREAWLKAIDEDGLVWTQVLDEKGISSTLYGVRYIPTTYLIDPNGVILAVNLEGEQLQTKLEEIFNQ